MRLALILLAALLAMRAGAAVRVETPAEALATDAAHYATQFALTQAEAERRLRAQEASVPLVAHLAAAYADRLAGVEIEHRPDYRIVLHVTGGAAADLPVAVAPEGVPVVLRPGALATRDRTLQAIAHHAAALRAILPYPAALGVVPQSGALLVVSRIDDPAMVPALVARLRAIAGVPVALREWLAVDADLQGSDTGAPPAPVPPSTSFAVGGGRVSGSETAGGRRFICTAGFVVTDGSGQALTTAAHCPDQLDLATADHGRVPLTLIGAWGAGDQDVQLHAAPVPLLPLFHADGDALRVVAGTRSRLATRAGDFLCHRGERTGYSCALVRFPDFSPPGALCAGPCPARWVAVNGPDCRGGDSGGPVFLGQVAFGLVKGESSAADRCQLYYYMAVDALPPGWAVVTAPADAVPVLPPPSPPPPPVVP